MNKTIKHSMLMLLLSIATALQAAQPEPQPSRLDQAEKILKVGICAAIFLPIVAGIIRNIAQEAQRAKHPKTKVGVIHIQGPITDSTRYIRQLHSFFENETIKAVVLKVASPGGAAGTSQAIFNEILELKKTNPKFVVALVENEAASGGYYIASAADYIISTPSAIVGSIGVYMEIPVYHKFLEQYNIKYEYIKNGEHKTAGNPLVNLTDIQRAHLQLVSDSIYQQFVNDVAAQRKKASIADDANIWAQGKIFTGEQALKLGLVDKLGSVSTVIEVLKEQAKITNKIEWIHPKLNGGIFASLFGIAEDEDGSSRLELFTKSIVQGVTKAIKSEVTNQTSISC